jgi:hypothetical protein
VREGWRKAVFSASGAGVFPAGDGRRGNAGPPDGNGSSVRGDLLGSIESERSKMNKQEREAMATLCLLAASADGREDEAERARLREI